MNPIKHLMYLFLNFHQVFVKHTLEYNRFRIPILHLFLVLIPLVPPDQYYCYFVEKVPALSLILYPLVFDRSQF